MKDRKLGEAYQPPQVDALAALDEASRIIDEQKQKVDDEIAGQQQEAIRQAFIRIRGDEEKLAIETTLIFSPLSIDPRCPLRRSLRPDGVRHVSRRHVRREATSSHSRGQRRLSRGCRRIAGPSTAARP